MLAPSCNSLSFSNVSEQFEGGGFVYAKFDRPGRAGPGLHTLMLTVFEALKWADHCFGINLCLYMTSPIQNMKVSQITNYYWITCSIKAAHYVLSSNSMLWFLISFVRSIMLGIMDMINISKLDIYVIYL